VEICRVLVTHYMKEIDLFFCCLLASCYKNENSAVKTMLVGTGYEDNFRTDLCAQPITATFAQKIIHC
jgi:hypothetical protein